MFKSHKVDIQFGKDPEPFPYRIHNDDVKIDNDRKIISFKKLNMNTLFRRIANTYSEKYIQKLFYRTYSNKGIELYYKKRIKRRQMKAVGFIVPLFFALELVVLFNQLGKKYRDSKYIKIAKKIYDESWVSKSNDIKPDKINIDKAISILNNKYKLKDYQLEFINEYPKMKASSNLYGIYNAFDQGLGKTLTALTLALSLEVDYIYIVCPNNLVNNWILEISDYYNNKIKSHDCRNTKAERNTKVFIINNESIDKMYRFIKPNKKSILIVDEAHNFRNYNGERVTKLLELRDRLKPSDILLMSGTPIKATPIEIVPALLLLDPLFTPTAGRIYTECFKFSNYEAMEIITSRFNKIIYRKLKSDVLTLPNKFMEDLLLQVEDPSSYLLKNIREEVNILFNKYLLETIEDNKTIAKEFEYLVRKYSTTSSSNNEHYISRIIGLSNDSRMKELHDIDEMKIQSFLKDNVLSSKNITANDKKTLISYEKKLSNFRNSAMGKAVGKIYPQRRNELYSELWLNNEDCFIELIKNCPKKTIIFSQFEPVVNFICRRLELRNIKVSKITGKVSNSNRIKILEDFKYDETYEVLIATSQTVGTGFTFTCASQMFFFGTPWRATDFAQCCDRIYRLGQDMDVYINTVLLDTEELNLSSKMDKILKWSDKMFRSAIDNNDSIIV